MVCCVSGVLPPPSGPRPTVLDGVSHFHRLSIHGFSLVIPRWSALDPGPAVRTAGFHVRRQYPSGCGR
jgi:hypothetical protein